QQAAVDAVLAKVDLAVTRTGCRTLIVGGGVTSNTLLRTSLERLGRERDLVVVIPPRELCTDNAAMGAIAWERLERGEPDGQDLDIRPGTDRRRA
ncbi:tRNA (adenosine(37)-N6)-threonylcarbamoyltransferase complex transferase subunit TsaD, partial [bacterium]|nr:tRNA (adenosine(37)-N6)-threonylcarbamoyltransferase complex transferase subunit TsaD [bacterium]